MKRLVVALVFTSAFLLLTACGGDPPTENIPAPTPTRVPTASVSTLPAETSAANTTTAAQSDTICAPGTKPAYITALVLAKNTEGDNFTPVDVTEEYEPSQETLHAVLSLQNAPTNLKLSVKWYFLQGEGYKPNTLMDQNDLTAAGNPPNVDFSLQNTIDFWPPGSYCVEIYAEGNLALSKQFTVAGDPTPSNAGIEVVRQVVLAEAVDPGTFTPINPTTTFKSSAPFIHAAVEVFDAPLNTRFRSRWYPPTQGPLNLEQIVDGSRWMDFRLTPTPTGFPTGNYKVEIYVNDQLAKAVEFTVE